MTVREPLDRVVFLEAVEAPLNVYGKAGPMEKVWDRRKFGALDNSGQAHREATYEFYFEAPFIIIRDPRSGHEEEYPLHLMRQMRTVASVAKAEKMSGAKPPQRGMQLP